MELSFPTTEDSNRLTDLPEQRLTDSVKHLLFYDEIVAGTVDVTAVMVEQGRVLYRLTLQDSQ